MSIRPLSWHDIPLLLRLRKTGICLEPRMALTRGASTIHHLLQDAFIPGGSAVTLVSKSAAGPDGYGQLLHRQNEPLASLVFLSPEGIFQQTDLIEAMSSAAGERGAFNLVASIDEAHPGFEALRKADFHIYARQTIWQYNQPEQALTKHKNRWRDQRISDMDAIQGLYLILVPALVQQVETRPDRGTSGLVYWEKGDLLGAVLLERGPEGAWAQILVHPAAEHVQDLIEEFLATAGPWPQPLHVFVRSYQSWLGPVLAQAGFSSQADQAVMVKRLAVGLHKPAMNHVPVLDTVRPEVTASITDWERTSSLAEGTKRL